MTRSLAFTLLVIASLPAAAQQSPWYLGLSAGQSRTGSEFITNREEAIRGAINLQSAFDDKDGAWKGTAGYRFTPNIAVEASYADYGSIRSDTRFQVINGATGAGGFVVDRSVKGFGADLVIAAPLGNSFSLWGRLGWLRADLKAQALLSGDIVFSDGTPGNSRSTSAKENVAKFGVGVDWSLTRQASLRLEWERLSNAGKKFAPDATGSTGEADMDTWMLGVLWRF